MKGALTDADAARLADIAGIPDENRKQFTDDVGRAIAAARRHHSITPRRKLPTPADKANKAALQFVRSLRAIPPDQPDPFAAVLPFGSAYPSRSQPPKRNADGQLPSSATRSSGSSEACCF